jgi:O-antigen/teichoic acid export membrane protein
MSAQATTVALNRSFRRGFTLAFTADLLTKCLSAVTVVVLIRGLTVSAYAYTTLFLTLAQFAGAAAGGGVRTRYLREEAESVSRGTGTARTDLFLVSLIKGTLLVAAIGLCVLPIVGPLHLGARFGARSSLIFYAVAFAAGYGATELAIAHHQARRRFAMAGILSVIRAGALLVAAALISFTHQDVFLLSVSFVVSMVAVGLTTAVPIAWPALTRAHLSLSALKFDREESWLSLYYLAAAGFAYVDVLVASALLDQRQVATLGVAIRYLTIVLAAVPSLGAILRVRTAQADMVDSRSAQRKMILRWMRAGAVPVLLGLGLMVALSPWVIPIVNGGRYPGSVPVLQIFLITAASSYLSAPAASVMMTQRRYAALAAIFGVGLAINLVGDVLVAHRFGVVGIAIVSTAVYVALDVAMTLDALRHAARDRYPVLRARRGVRLTPAQAVQVLVTSLVALIIAALVVGASNHTPSFLASAARTRSARAAPSKRSEGPGGRRWYAPSSLWNTPIGADPRIAPNDASLVSALASTPAIGVSYQYTPAIWYATSTTPKVPVRIDVPRCDARTVWVPIPRGAVPDPSSEGHMAVAQSGTGTEFDFYKAQAPGGPPKSSVYYAKPCPTVNEWTAAKLVTTNWETGSGELPGSPRGSGTSEGAGTILPRDTQMPAGSTWDHALGVAYRYTCSDSESWCPVVAPATQEDGTCTDQAMCLPEGVRLQLDPSINCRTWPSLIYTWQQQMCRTLQVYGAIVIDTNDAGPTFANQSYVSLKGYAWPWLQEGDLNLPRSLLAHFRVLAWH